MLAPATVLQNRYHILRQIGGGGMGTVYLAEDSRLQARRCAVKEMSPEALAPQDRDWSVEVFRQEAQLLAQLHHPGLAPVTDFFEEFGNWYLVMDYVEGETLQRRLAATPGGRFALPEALRIALEILDVLAFLHGQPTQVVFRDLKPSNVMLTPEGQVKLIDFGIARFFKPGQAQDTALLGTPGYAAPEQYGGLGQSDARTDIYSMGVLLNQMVTGFDPVTAVSPFPLPNPRATMPEIPPAIAGVIVRATQMRPELRFASATEMRQALFETTRPAKAGTTVPAPGRDATRVMPQSSAPLPTVKRHKAGLWIGAGAALALLAVCGGGGLLALSQGWVSFPRQRTATVTPTGSEALAALPTITPSGESAPGLESTATEEVTAESPPTVSVGDEATATTVPPSPTPAPLQLALVRGDVGDSDIVIAGADGGSQRCVACAACDEAEPAWSPDGLSIAYQANCEGSYDIWVVDLATGNTYRLTRTADLDEREPDWSPDGSQLVLRVTPKDMGRNEDGELQTIRRDGSDATLLGLAGRSPAWSPDGDRLVFMSERDGSWDIYVVDLETRQTRNVSNCSVNCRWPAWSPGGDAVAYHTTTGATSTTAEAIWVTPMDGGAPVQLVTGSHAGRPSWSAEGLVVFNSDIGIEVVTPDGKNRRTLISGDVHWAPAWSR